MKRDEIGEEWDEHAGMWWHQCVEGVGWVYQTDERHRDVGIKVTGDGWMVTTQFVLTCRGCKKSVEFEDEWLDEDGKHLRRDQ